ncbi:shikimate 5-dehydrogenase [Chlamydia ibidis]|uniref:shikimate dehydrogenase (NADP(+)) n=2 Tax=Chlamydia ibidis TaxID=1405396 RepID=S7J2L7_9CHLA|nr:bifunctional 3-dehydroquinate dehydratase/shikimate dehydrogenase [Chlamydia ibidis]EPP34669.1 shikimate 5-dehydrogenase [Chlamydia ibidis]EQM62419.1 shikimate 5-dehydrogenase [Chlamydia ibidis 10-1398/6]
MLCATISGPSFLEAKTQILHSLPLVDAIELRVDRFSEVSNNELASLVRLAKRTILTFQKPIQLTRAQWVLKIQELADLCPDYLDVDKSFPKNILNRIRSKHPQIKIILSHHSNTWEPINELYNVISKTQVDYYKIAVTPQSSLETLQCMCQKQSLPDNVTAICMGNYGIPARVLSPLVNNNINYSSGIGAPQAAPGQLSVTELLSYNYSNLTPDANIYALIGNPVNRSISHRSHNHFFSLLGISASYVKILLNAEELPEFFKLAHQLNFKGVSVTMPLKTEVLKHVDILDPTVLSCQSCNTLVFDQNKIVGYNTDGLGLLNLMCNYGISIKNKSIAILGAGGAAKAIATTLSRFGGNVYIFNRSKPARDELADLCSGKSFPLDMLSDAFPIDIIINCLPPNIPFKEIFAPIVIDINTQSRTSPYLEKSREYGSVVLYGYQMFMEQALLQFAFWFPGRLSPTLCAQFRQEVTRIMTEESQYANKEIKAIA